jgi:hypothetical protein
MSDRGLLAQTGFQLPLDLLQTSHFAVGMLGWYYNRPRFIH